MLLSALDRQVIASWRDRALRRHASGPRIAVVGNCQSFGVAYAMQLLDLEAEIARFSIVSKSWTDMRTLARTLATYDHVFAQDFAPGYLRGGVSAVLQNELGEAVWFPSLAFSAYHPDLILISDPTRGNQLVNCATGPYHSALAFFGYRAGLPPEAALRLFRREVFAALGYFEVWEGAAEALLEQGRQFGLDLGADFLRWARRGCFMYSINHPKPYVLYDIARRLLRGVGRPAEPVDFDTYAVDDIVRGYVFPVYPEIAELYGSSGSYIFKASHYRLSKGLGKFWDLPGYLRDCYRIYAEHPPEQLVNERVQGWLDDADTSKLLRDFAAGAGSPLATAA
jgi:Polysaccharide biosynthesis enzyme WcbI